MSKADDEQRQRDLQETNDKVIKSMEAALEKAKSIAEEALRRQRERE